MLPSTSNANPTTERIEITNKKMICVTYVHAIINKILYLYTVQKIFCATEFDNNVIIKFQNSVIKIHKDNKGSIAISTPPNQPTP